MIPAAVQRTWVAFCLFVLPCLGGAQTVVPVRTGEHGAFTRIVIQLPVGSKWELTQADGSARLTVNGEAIQFGLSDAFRRIGRTRISDMSEDNSELRVRLACDCSVVASEESGGLVVLDVSERAERSVASARRRGNAILPLINSKPYRFSLDAANAAGTPRPAANSLTSGIGALANTPDSAPTTSRLGETRQPLPLIWEKEQSQPDILRSPKELLEIGLLEQRISERMQRAKRQGLVSGKVTAPADIPQKTKSMDERTPMASAPADADGQTVGVAVTTAIDRDLLAISQAANRLKQPTEPQCPKTINFLRDAVEATADYSTTISDLRTELVTELDSVRTDVLFELAKAYLSFGFGAEGRRTLDMLERTKPSTELLYAIADLMDGIELTSNPFGPLQTCGDDFALWDFVAQPSERGAIDVEAILRGFLSLPLDLRENLGPRIAQNFLDLGKSDDAARVIRATRRTQENLNPDLMMVEAAVAIDVENVSKGQAILEDVVQLGTEQSPEALIELVEQYFLERSGVPSQDVGLLASYGQEYRDTEYLVPLQRAQVLGHALNGAFDEAISTFDQADALQASTFLVETKLDLFQLVLENASDFDFARLGAFLLDTSLGPLPKDLSLPASERFLALGLTSSAQRALLAGPSSELSDAERLLEARIQLEMRLPHQAMIALLGIESEEANFLRAEAMALNADFDAAAPVYATAGASEDAAMAYYLAGQLDEIDTSDMQTRFGRLASTEQALETLTSSTDNEATLNSARDLLMQSEDARREIDSLLAE